MPEAAVPDRPGDPGDVEGDSLSTIGHGEPDQGQGQGRFGIVRRGYDRVAVDRFVGDTLEQMVTLRREIDDLEAQNRTLVAQRALGPDYASLGGRAQEILRVAEEQARDTTQRANGAADDLVAGAQRDADAMRDDTARELETVRGQRLGELDELRRRSEDDTALALERAQASAQQLLAAARLEAEAVRVEAEARARDLVQAAAYDAEQQRSSAQRDAAAVAADVAAHREATYAELLGAQEEAGGRVEAMLAEARRQQTTTAAHLTTETEQAVAVRAQALADAEQARTSANADADAMIARAQQQAATIDERARQEYTWRRRQMRQEQALLDQRRSAILGQLASLSALAAETAGNLPEVPEILFSEFESATAPADQRPGPTEQDHADPAGRRPGGTGSDDAGSDDAGPDRWEQAPDDDATVVRQPG